MKYIGVDTETHLISRGVLAPRLVCASFCDSKTKWVEDAVVAVVTLEKYLDDPEIVLVIHNAQFDMVVFCAYAPHLTRKIFEAYKSNRIRCTKIRQILFDIANGEFQFKYEDDGTITPQRYGLDNLCERYRLPRLDKTGDSYRLRYSELDGIPAGHYPPEAYDYAADDAEAHLNVFLRQQGGAYVVNEFEQCRQAFALQLTSCRGLRTDKVKVEEIERQLTIEAVALRNKMEAHGIFRSDGTKDTTVLKQLVIDAFTHIGLPVPMTDKGNVKTDADTLKLSGDEILIALGDGQGPLKLLNTFVPTIKAAVDVPLIPGYEVMIVTGRTSSKNPMKQKKGEPKMGCNIQQLPRDRRDKDGKVILGIRNCFIPREGYDFCSCDYSVAELRTLAQVHYQSYGTSALRDWFIAGVDPHLVMAAALMGKSFDWVRANVRHPDFKGDIKDARTMGKIANFGIPGGLGEESLIEFARTSYGKTMTRDEARGLISTFHQNVPEQKMVFRDIKTKIGPTEGTIAQVLGQPIVHGRRTFTKGCNLLFQGSVAQIAKEALWRVTWECYLGDDGWKQSPEWQNSPLYGSFVVAFIHDELILEIPNDDVPLRHEAAYRCAAVMIEAAVEIHPDVPAVVEPALMSRKTGWDKNAEPAFDANDWLVPFDEDGWLP